MLTWGEHACMHTSLYILYSIYEKRALASNNSTHPRNLCVMIWFLVVHLMCVCVFISFFLLLLLLIQINAWPKTPVYTINRNSCKWLFLFGGCILIFIRILTLVRCVAQHFWPVVHVMCAMCIVHRASCIFGVWTMYEVPDRKESIHTNAQWTFHFHFDSMYVYMQRSLVVVVVVIVVAAVATATATATDAVACFFPSVSVLFCFH